MAVSVACMTIYWPTPGFKGRIFKLCFLIRWDLIFLCPQLPTHKPKLDCKSKTESVLKLQFWMNMNVTMPWRANACDYCWHNAEKWTDSMTDRKEHYGTAKHQCGVYLERLHHQLHWLVYAIMWSLAHTALIRGYCWPALSLLAPHWLQPENVGQVLFRIPCQDYFQLT